MRQVYRQGTFRGFEFEFELRPTCSPVDGSTATRAPGLSLAPTHLLRVALGGSIMTEEGREVRIKLGPWHSGAYSTLSTPFEREEESQESARGRGRAHSSNLSLIRHSFSLSP